MEPLVSVVIPTYNREATIQRALESIMGQTYKNIEIIVVDDGSSDNTVKKIKEYEDERIILLCQSEHGGANRARNYGIRYAKGEFIAFQDSDDEWLPDKLEKQICYMKQENYKVCFCSYKLWNGNKYINTIPDDYDNFDAGNIKQELLKHNIIGTPALVVHESVIKDIGGFDEKLPRLQDYEFVIRIIRKYEIGFLDIALLNAYRMENAISTCYDSYLQALIWIINKHKDFLNLSAQFEVCVESFDIIKEGKINWDVFDDVILKLHLENESKNKELFYKAAISCLHKKLMRSNDFHKGMLDCYVCQLVNKEFIIYGAGMIGRMIYDELRRLGLYPKYFAVTKDDGCVDIDSIPVLELSQIKDKNMPVVVGVSKKYWQEVVEHLNYNGYFRYFIYPNISFLV